ncbi:MAG: putative lipopolysaccharide heptosyltransferase III [Betaproteobacteria bacterium]|nr:putative lipopolysaccharide heptosyltransferase III [Betaproteobacteria bacterium]
MTPLSYQYPDLSSVRRVLVTKLRHHGDVLLASPVLTSLRRRFPEAEIDALVYRDTREMLAGHPALARLHTIDRAWRQAGLLARWRAERALLGQLKGRRYDLLVHLSTHNRGAWLARLLAPACSVAPARPGRFWRGSFTHLYQEVGGNRRHTVENNLDSLRRIGIWPEPADKRLVLMPGDEAAQTAQAHLDRLGLAAGRYLLLHPTSRWLFKCWPEARVTELAQRLLEEGHSLLFTSGPDARETAMVERIRAGIGRPVASLAGQLTLPQLAALIARARLFIGVDSAPMHMAAAVGAPVAALFGPSGEIDWGPWMAQSRVITSRHTCRPCGRDGCGGSKRSDCLESISVEEVHAAVAALLGPA